MKYLKRAMCPIWFRVPVCMIKPFAKDWMKCQLLMRAVLPVEVKSAVHRLFDLATCIY